MNGSGAPGRDPGPDPWEGARRHMVDDQIAGRGIRDPRVLAAMLAVPRHRFVERSRRVARSGIIPMNQNSAETVA